jgi:hypothetical protein
MVTGTIDQWSDFLPSAMSFTTSSDISNGKTTWRMATYTIVVCQTPCHMAMTLPAGFRFCHGHDERFLPSNSRSLKPDGRPRNRLRRKVADRRQPSSATASAELQFDSWRDNTTRRMPIFSCCRLPNCVSLVSVPTTYNREVAIETSAGFCLLNDES